MKFLPDTDIRYLYNLKSDMTKFETTFEVRKQKLKLKDVNNNININ